MACLKDHPSSQKGDIMVLFLHKIDDVCSTGEKTRCSVSASWLSYQLIIIGSSIPIYTRIHFIHISLVECYYTFNNKDHWDPGLFTFLHITLQSSNGVLYLDRLSGAQHCISWPAIGCSSYTHILSRYQHFDFWPISN